MVEKRVDAGVEIVKEIHPLLHQGVGPATVSISNFVKSA